MKQEFKNLIETASKVINESVEHLDEAWTADSVIKNAKIGSKKGYGINIKKTGGVTKTPHKHMLMTTRKHGNVRVTFDHGKDEFEGTPQSVALYINKKLGIKESVELDEAKPEYQVKYAKTKKGRIQTADFMTSDQAKSHLAKRNKEGYKGIISRGGKPVTDSVEYDENLLKEKSFLKLIGMRKFDRDERKRKKNIKKNERRYSRTILGLKDGVQYDGPVWTDNKTTLGAKVGKVLRVNK